MKKTEGVGRKEREIMRRKERKKKKSILSMNIKYGGDVRGTRKEEKKEITKEEREEDNWWVSVRHQRIRP